MQQRKRYLGWVIVMLLVGLWGLNQPVTGHAAELAPATEPEMRPTLFFHGSSSSYLAEKHMVHAAKRAGVTKSVIRADVSYRGKVHLVGKIKKTAENPIVEVNYLNSNNLNYRTNGRWAKNVVKKLQKTYHIKSMNMVGHSMGNMAIMYYLLANGTNRKLPRLHKQVALGGHFEGVFGEDDYPHYLRLAKSGRPNHMDTAYRQLLRLRKTYPKKQVSVLNIYGDLGDGTDSDGRVSNNSSRSLRYLVGKRALHYRSKQFKGRGAQHSKLHHNAKVDKLLIKFLWS